MTNFKNFVFAIILVVGLFFTSGCTATDKAADTAKKAGETVTRTASDAGKEVKRLVRRCGYTTWTNSDGSEVTVEERRFEGDYKITIDYTNVDGSFGDDVELTDSLILTMYVKELTDDVMSEIKY